ncbi:hypothetical protein [Phocaeicola acetigenes]|jgi:hypothetical protein|uniref:Uncharacterized protein n=1 Tax=Phocaeicola acetigenes TaxID=3016083 RepID=A0ABT4PKI8_9BACT|nr:hypothetical protein [Phocaeicola sp. KGMB11183]MCZ8373576.1 hypothetical protein [Phocaeicola sp. KGMB11183]
MKTDSELAKKYGKKIPFKTPEGYFDNFTEQLMKQLPEKETVEMSEISMWERVKPWVYMVAMFCGLMFSIRVIVGEKPENKTDYTIESISELPDEYIEPLMEQTMMDDYTLYQYLTDADTPIYP